MVTIKDYKISSALLPSLALGAALVGGGMTSAVAYGAGIPNFPCYKTVEETFAMAENFAKTYPDLAEWVDVGDSWQKANGKQGYDMNVLVLTNKKIKGEKPKLFATSAIHAREFATAELMSRFAQSLVENYGKDPDVTWMLDHQEVHLMLQTNPDGRKKAEPNVMWRKNVNDNICNRNGQLGQGVDLNRNMPYRWIYGGSNTKCGDTYRGESAGSEPETQAVVAYMRKLFKDVRGPEDMDKAPEDTPGIYLDIHSFGSITYYPKNMGNTPGLLRLVERYGYFNTYAPKPGGHGGTYADAAPSFLSPERVKAGVYESHRRNYTYTQAYGDLGVASALFELGKRFFERCNDFEDKVLPDNLKALMYALRVVRAPYMLSKGPEAIDLKLDGKKLSATLDDSRFFPGPEKKGEIVVSAQYFVDTPPWQEGAKGEAMALKDGTADKSSEAFEADIDVNGLATGRHTIYVQGKDQEGNLGPVSAIWLDVN